MSTTAKPISEYFKDLNTNEWEIIFETTANMAVKSKINNASLCIIPNDKQVVTLVFKINAIVVLTVGADKISPIVNVSWENKLLISQNMNTVTGN
jgi:hypothetical protein